MLKLKKIQILGFKSFCDRTEVHCRAREWPWWWGRTDAASRTFSTPSAGCLASRPPKPCAAQDGRRHLCRHAGRKPLGMAEVSLTLVDPEVYEGRCSASPKWWSSDGDPDWDEAEDARQQAAETEEIIAEAQPGMMIGEDGSECGASQTLRATPDGARRSAPAKATHGEKIPMWC